MSLGGVKTVKLVVVGDGAVGKVKCSWAVIFEIARRASLAALCDVACMQQLSFWGRAAFANRFTLSRDRRFVVDFRFVFRALRFAFSYAIAIFSSFARFGKCRLVC